MRSFLGVPIVSHGEVFGNLYLTEKVGASEFTLEDQAIAVLLAAQAAVAVANARLNDESQPEQRRSPQDPNLPHSVEIIADADPLPVGPVPPAFDHATTGRLDQGFAAGQGADIRFVADKVGSLLIFCAIPGHGAAGMWIRLTVAAGSQPALATAP